MFPVLTRGRPGQRAVTRIVLLGLIALAAFALTGRRPEGRPPLLRYSSVAPGSPDLALDSAIPREPVELLFFQGRPAVAGSGNRRAVVSETGTLLTSSSMLEVRPVALSLGGRAVLAAAPAEHGGWWISTLDGELVKVTSDGSLSFAGPAPFEASALWPHPASGGVLATRSPERFGFLPEMPEAPVVVALDPQGQPFAGRGRIVVPEHSLLATLANSGYAVAAGDTVFFAPLSRSEVTALGPRGDTLWTSRAEEVPPTPEPRIRLVGGQVRIEYQPLNLGLTLGPDGRIYLLRATDTAVTSARLDVLERRSGRTLWRAKLPGPRVTLAANRRGRVYILDEDRLLGAISPAEREPLPALDLPRLGGGRVALGDLTGRVVLINLWASWCVPCRVEMPALDSLAASLTPVEFSLVAISEDEQRRDAERFVAELGLSITVLFGDGRLRSRLHYPGLPYTLLLDRQGRIVRRWIGQLSRGDLELIRVLVLRELSAPPSGGGPSHSHHDPSR